MTTRYGIFFSFGDNKDMKEIGTTNVIVTSEVFSDITSRMLREARKQKADGIYITIHGKVNMLYNNNFDFIESKKVVA